MKKRKPRRAPGKRLAVFPPEFPEDLRYWVRIERRTAIRVLDLVEDVLRHPFEGVGKLLEHRLVYLVRKERIDFLQVRYHY